MAKLNKLREQVANEIISALKEDKIPWEQEWLAQERPRNAVTGTAYRGLNSFWLSYSAQSRQYEDPRWCTFKQAQDKGWTIKKGSNGVKCEFWSMYDTEDKKKISPARVKELQQTLDKDEFNKRVKPISSIFTVFNGRQIEGIPELEKKEPAILNPDEIINVRDTLIRNMELSFKEGGDKAYYSPGFDEITMPAVQSFNSEYAYISTFFHEAGHATGAEHRFNRDLTGIFGSQSYAKEELRAEIASAFTSIETGFDICCNRIDNHKAYIQSWISVLEDNPNELFAAIKDAEKISDYLIKKSGLKVTEDLESTEKSESDYYLSTTKKGKDALVKEGYTNFVEGKDGQYIFKVKESDEQAVNQIVANAMQNKMVIQ